ncbi:PREDICTED: calmodulin-binding receptor-like cytoplasmic kinase 2 [Tarenaya hassleriana]|uniref:calmodulin-binding receptor-like cytoplasmic kinase 2 n=1 Tax=Tarenaya hassleriana TaxID=28532 RepID=UPI00053C5C24|nr:PREDICTED: calmodulin-binding receptor-like cytoplasmic kinase 2 [Tarenaya hassleriana]
MYNSRRPSSVAGSSPATASFYTDVSSSTAASSDKSTSSVARRIAGLFINCFTPPDPVVSKSSDSYSEYSSRPRRSSQGSNQRHYGNSKDAERPRFTFEEICATTKNFSPTFKIGQGGFGTVYKGKLRDGTTVAIKRAKKSIHDDREGAEFLSEIQTLARIQHMNLVKFYGYLVHEDEKILVVEYVAYGTLREHLDGKHGNILDLATRLDIAIDVAHAITYLHMYTDHPIIHRDIKSSNILLTENFRAKVADFGFARLAADSETGATHVSTQVKGTAGYLDPEYLTTYQLTEKSDVYSFGVLLIELVTGRRPIEANREHKERITIKWAIKKFTNGDAITILDPKLERNPANNLAVEKVLEMAFQCVAPHRRSRPSMKRCNEILWGIRKDYRAESAMDTRSVSCHPQTSNSVSD